MLLKCFVVAGLHENFFIIFCFFDSLLYFIEDYSNAFVFNGYHLGMEKIFMLAGAAGQVEVISIFSPDELMRKV